MFFSSERHTATCDIICDIVTFILPSRRLFVWILMRSCRFVIAGASQIPQKPIFCSQQQTSLLKSPLNAIHWKWHRCRDEPLLREQDTRNDAVQMAALTSSLAMMLPEKHVVPGYAKNSPEFMLFRAVKQMDNEAKKLSQPHRSTDSRNRSAWFRNKYCRGGSPGKNRRRGYS